MLTFSHSCTERYFINNERLQVLYVCFYYQISMNAKPKMAVAPINVSTFLGPTIVNVAKVQR